MFISKYSASGNDFVIFHTFLEKDYSDLAKTLCHRQNGIGADGLIVVLPCETEDFKWLFYNSDGSRAAMCGNGTRAIAHFAYSHNIVSSSSVSFETEAGVIKCNVEGDIVETTLTKPIIKEENFTDFGYELCFYDTGVPHIVIFDKFDFELASKIRYKYNANVNFVEIKDEKTLYVRTYERGVENETQACGTGMAASFLCSFRKGLCLDTISVFPTSKEELFLRYENDLLYFKGKVKESFNTCIS